MFRDLKEYQQLRALYEEQVYSTDLDKEVKEIFLEENFTDEELLYVHENIDVLIEDHLLIEGVEQAQLDEVVKSLGKAAVKTVGKVVSKGAGKTTGKALSKGAGGLASRMSSGFAKNVSKIPPANRLGGSGAITKATGAAGGALSKFKNVASKLKDKAGKLIKKGVDFVKKNKTAVGGGAALGALAVGGGVKRALDRRAAINKQELNQKDPDDPTSKSNTGAPEAKRTEGGDTPTPKQTEQPAQQAKPKKMGEIERRNRERLGNKRVDFLKQKQKDFKSMDRAEFRKKYPKSQSAKDAAARKRRPSVMDYESYKPDAYDMVLEYLLSSQQAATIEEANYIMTEMDAKTIQDIVSQQLNEQN